MTRITEREAEVFAYLAQGMNVQAVADQMGLSHHTVRTHIRNVLNRLNAHTRTHAVAILLSQGRIPQVTQ